MKIYKWYKLIIDIDKMTVKKRNKNNRKILKEKNFALRTEAHPMRKNKWEKETQAFNKKERKEHNKEIADEKNHTN